MAATTLGVPPTIEVGSYPSGVAVDPGTHNVYVANNADNTVSVIDETGDGSTGTVTATIGVGVAPSGVAVDPSTQKVFVANSVDNTVSVIDESGDGLTGTVTATIAVGSYPSGVAVDPTTHTVYVTNYDDSTVSVIDESGGASTGAVTATIAVGDNPFAVAVDPTTHNVYVTNSNGNTVSVIDESGDGLAGTVTATIAVGSYPSGVAVDPVTHQVYVANSVDSTVSVIDESGGAASGIVTATIGVGQFPSALAVDPTTHNLYVSNFFDFTVSVIQMRVSQSIAGRVTDATTGAGIGQACVQVEKANSGVRVTLLHANSMGTYSGMLPVGSYKLIAIDCVGGTHATTYYGGADDYDFLGPSAKAVSVAPGSVTAGLDIALPLAGTVRGVITDTASGLGIAGICAYAIDTTQDVMRGYSAPTTASGGYEIAKLPPGIDRVAFQPCTTGPYPLTYSNPVTVTASGVTTVNHPMTQA
jgi:YVTN family beta-propeller protein